VSRIQSPGGRAAFCCADIGKASEIKALFDFAESRFGGVGVLTLEATRPNWGIQVLSSSTVGAKSQIK
jgi:NAD(P)-dependent dehydrogenase (short-subunit alcohol dehydrogenase family)